MQCAEVQLRLLERKYPLNKVSLTAIQSIQQFVPKSQALRDILAGQRQQDAPKAALTHIWIGFLVTLAASLPKLV